jgi:hypothetical protein
MEEPLLIPQNQGITTTQTQIPNTFSNNILTKLNTSSYLRIIPKDIGCLDLILKREIILSVHTIQSLDSETNENDTESFLFKATFTYPCIPCLPSDFEVKCYTGSNLDSASEYFCSFFIKAPPLCNFQPCLTCFSCSNLTFNNLEFKIAPKNLEINQDNQVSEYGKIERYMTCMRFNVRKFYDYNQNDFKYQIGKEDCILMCNIPVCNITCKFECPPPCIANCSQICKPIRLKFKNILDKNLNECGEFYTVDTPKLLCLCSKRTYEIRFPNDANVSMKLLLLGGLFEAIFMPYGSNP